MKGAHSIMTERKGEGHYEKKTCSNGDGSGIGGQQYDGMCRQRESCFHGGRGAAGNRACGSRTGRITGSGSRCKERCDIHTEFLARRDRRCPPADVRSCNLTFQ